MTNKKKQPKPVEIQAVKRPNGGTDHKLATKDTVGIKDTLSAVHEAHWSAKSYSILAILLALLLGLVGLISYGVYELIPLSTGLKIALLFIVFFALVIAGCWQRYRVLMFTHWLDRKSTAKKTHHSK